MVKLRESFFVAILVGAVLCVTDSKPGYCHDRGIDIKAGETVSAPIGWCEKVTCQISADGVKYLEALTCSEFVPRQGCHQSELDLTKRYPDCCPRSVCPDEDNCDGLYYYYNSVCRD